LSFELDVSCSSSDAMAAATVSSTTPLPYNRSTARTADAASTELDVSHINSRFAPTRAVPPLPPLTPA
jgi:hypothetical protein